MKKIAILSMVLLLAFALQAFSQEGYPIGKGSLIIGGSALFSSQGGDDANNNDRLTTIELNTRIGYFIIAGMAIGGNLSLISQSYGDETATLLGIGPEISYFFGSEESNFFPFMSTAFTYYNFSDGGDYSETAFSFGGGLAYMLTEHVALTAEAFFQFENYRFDDESAGANTIGITIGLAAFLY